MITLDASAILVLLLREPGAETVAAALEDSCASTVNMAEVLSRFVRVGKSGLLVLERLRMMPVEWVDFDANQAAVCAELLPRTRHLGLSLGDRACLALAASRACPAMTADATWRKLDVGTEIVLIR